MKKLITKILTKVYWYFQDCAWLFIKLFNVKLNTKKNNIDFTIGITTFLDRFDNTFKNLIYQVTTLFPDNQIIVAVNGHVKITEQKLYLKNIHSFTKQFNMVELITYETPQGLSKLWNQIIINAKNNKILILNDDLKLSTNFNKKLTFTNVFSEQISVLNNSWSHFLINKSIVERIGYFDENLIEIGGEDDDFAARLALNNIPIKFCQLNYITTSLKRNKKILEFNSYGKNMNFEKNGYSSINENYLRRKWKFSNTPFPNAIEVPNRLYRYWKLNK